MRHPRGSRGHGRLGALLLGALAFLLAAATAEPAAAQGTETIATRAFYQSSLDGDTLQINCSQCYYGGHADVVNPNEYQIADWPATGSGTLTIDSVFGYSSGNWIRVRLRFSGTFTNDILFRVRVGSGVSSSGDPEWTNQRWAFAEDPRLVVGDVTGTPTESGGTASFPVRLRTWPSATVKVAVTSRDTLEGTVSADTLEFTTGNWNRNQTVTVTGVDDATADGDQNYNINLDPSSTDADYNALDSVDVAMTTVDDDGGPTVNSVTISSTPASGDTYGMGEQIEVQVGFSQAVDVVGAPVLTLGVGSATVPAAYATGHGSSTLTFRYNVLHGDADTDGISIGAGALGLAAGARIRVQGGVGGASVDLSSYAITNSTNHKVDATQGAPGVTGLSLNLPNVDGTFERAEVIRTTVTFSRAVEVTGTPQLALTIGTNTRQANYESGSGTTSLVFRYVVVTADSDSDGLSIGADALALNGGTIVESGGTTNAALHIGRRAISNSPDHVVNGSLFNVARAVDIATGNSPANNTTYTLGEPILFNVNFDRPVLVTGTPSIQGSMSGTDNKRFDYFRGSGTKTLVFRRVTAGNDREDTGYYVSTGNPINLRGGSITDARTGTNIVASLGEGLRSDDTYMIDGRIAGVPVVDDVTLNTPPAGDTFIGGDTIVATVEFDRIVGVTGTPQVAMTIGTTGRRASYFEGTGSQWLKFRYVVVQADNDANGVSVDSLALTSADSLRLPGSTSNANPALGTHAISNSANHKVNGTQGVSAPVVTRVAIGPPPVGATFESRDTISVEVVFDKNVDVVGTPQLALGIGAQTRQAAFIDGSGTDTLDFRYAVQSSDVDNDGISIGASALTLTSADSIRLAGTALDADLGLGSQAITNSASHRVAGGTVTPAAASAVVITSTPSMGATYVLGDTIEVEVEFNRPVVVTGTPQVALGIGSATRQAMYVSGDSTTALLFEYRVAIGDADGDGISIGGSALTLNGGEIDDERSATAAASLGLGSFTISNDGNHLVDAAQGPPGVSSLALNVPAVGDTYERGETIEATVTFNKAVAVVAGSGTPRLALWVGTDTLQASYATGSGSASLVFRYVVQSGNADADGISIGADALDLNGGTIRTSGGTDNAFLDLTGHAVTNSANHQVAGGTFTAAAADSVWVSSSPSDGNTYGTPETIEVTVRFARAVTVDETGGTPQVALTVGTETRQAPYVSSASTATALAFQYTVTATDADANGLSVGATALALNGGTINDARDATQAATLTLTAISDDGAHRVDGTQGPPLVSGLVLNAPVVGNLYERGETIEATVVFNKAVAVDVTGGTPQLALTIGSATRQAAYASGTGTDSLVFEYVVQSSDADSDGISIAANALGLNGGTIVESGGTATALLDLGSHAVTNDANHRVAGANFTAAAPDSVWLSSSPASGDTYGRTETIGVTVRFARPVAVDETGGTPQVAITVGTQTRQAPYVSSASTSTALVFRYVVVAADEDTDGVSVGASALTLNSGTINDARPGNTAATLTLSAITNDGDHKVDGNLGPPGVVGVVLGTPVIGDTYERGDTIAVTLAYNRAVDVVVTGGTPTLNLGIGSATRQATYASGTGTDSLEFRYVVQAGDTDADGISIGANALSRNGGTMQLAGGSLDADLTLGTHAVTNSAGHKVVGSYTAPVVDSVWVSSTAARSMTYELGEAVEVDVRFNRPVTVTGVPQLALGIGAGTVQAGYARGGGSRTLTFRYVVTATDADADGLSVGASALTLNAGAINDARSGSVAAALALGTNVITDDGDHLVDGTLATPRVVGLSIGAPPTGDTFERFDVIAVDVTFDRAVDAGTAGGRPRLALYIGTDTVQAEYRHRVSATVLQFRYTVQSTNTDADGISTADSLVLNGGTINQQGRTWAADLALGSHAVTTSSADHKVDGSAFNASSVDSVWVSSRPVSGNTYVLGDTLEVTVRFVRRVEVTGSPQLALGIGTETRQASWVVGAPGANYGTMAFRYVVAIGDADGDGISVGASALTLNSGTINDARSGGMAAALGLGTYAIANAASHLVDGNQGPPGVLSLALNTPAVGDTYERGETIEATVVYNKAVTVTGTPQLAVTVGTATVQANFATGTGTDSLVFRYVVQSGDADTDGISIGASALALNSGTIVETGGTANALLDLTGHTVANSGNHKVAGGTFTVAAADSIWISSNPASSDTYGRTEAIEVTVRFARAVAVDETGGTPQVALTVGTQTRQASYVSSASTSTMLVFRYVVVAADEDTDGISVAASPLALNGGTINDARPGGTAATLTVAAIATDANHKVDGSLGPPGVIGLVLNTPEVGDTYERGETIAATVVYNRAVDVVVTGGTPTLALSIGSATRQAAYASGTGTDSLVFEYVVQSGDADADGLSIAANALALNGGTMQLSGGTLPADLTLGTHVVTNSASHQVTGVFTASAVDSVAFTGTPAADSTYKLGETVGVVVQFTRPVTVTGSPQLALTIDNVVRQASYVSATSTSTRLMFSYAVRPQDEDTVGISIAAGALSGTIADARPGAAAAALGLGSHAVTNDAAHKVDGSLGPPGVWSLRLNSPVVGDTYERGDTIIATVTFNKSVTVAGGPPQLALGIGSATRQAAYATGSGTTALEFRYVVQSGDEDADGFSVGASALGLNGGTIQVTGGTDNALLGLEHYAVSNYLRVSGGTFNASSVSGVTVTSNPADGSTYGLSEVIEVAVEFSRPVDVVVTGGTPQLALTIGAATAQAAYVSASSTMDSLVFRYSVGVADVDTDGISVGTGALGLNGGGIFDSRDGTTAAALGLGSHAVSNASGQRVDGNQGPPGVVGVSLSAPVVSDTYERDDTVVVTVRFNKAVDVVVTGGTPQVALTIGSTTRQAVYASGTGTSALTFRYAVQSSDADADGISVGASALALNGGTIDVANGTVDAVLSLSGFAIVNSAGHKVVGTYTAPVVSGARVTSVPPAQATYGGGERLEVEVTFNRPVDVTGTPQLALILGTDTVQADFATGSGTRMLKFQYTVAGTDSDSDGISADALSLNSGAINDARSATVAASLSLGTHAFANDAAHKVDGTILPAAITDARVSSSPESGDTYGLGEQVAVQVTFDRSVTVTGGVPQLALTVGTATRQAAYVSGSGTAQLTFEYRVQGSGSGGSGAGGVDADANGLSVGASALTLNGATIVNTADGVRQASLSLSSNAIADDVNHKVDGTIEATPEVRGVTIPSEPTTQQGYGAGSEIMLQVSFSRPVLVTGVPRLALVIGASRRLAAYARGSGTPVLVFRYVVRPTDTDPDGFSVPANALELDGGTIAIFGGSATAALDLGSHAMDNVGGQAVAGGGATDPYFETPEYEFELTENVAGPVAVGVVLATDPYEGNMTYALGEGGEGLFEVAEWGGEVTYVGEGADAEERSEYVLEVVATAEDGRFGKTLVRVKVLNVNEPPAYGDERLAFELAENVAGPVVLGVAAAVDRDEGDTLTYRLESGDADRFEVDAATADVRYVGAGEDYDTDGPKSWELEVRATDKAGLSARKTVAVVLRNENEAPAFVDSTYAFEFAENVAGPLVLGTVRATDPDVRDRLSYALATGDATRFEVDARSGAVRYVGPGEDAEAIEGNWELVVRVVDGGGLTAEASVVVVLVDENEAPSFADASYEWEFEENVAGPLVLGTVRATDPDRADTLTYSLAGADAERFEIDAATGEVRYVGGGEDAEAGPEGWEFEVMVVDGGGLTAKAPVTVVLLDVNEAPLFADSAYAFELPENASGPRELGRVEATDVDADDVLTYSITSGDAGRFEVDAATGVVRYVGGGEDYETGPREYALMLRVTDTGGLTDEASAVVALLDVNEGPEAVGSMAPKVLEAYGAAVEEELGPYFLDPDGDALSYAAESSSEAVAVATVSSGRLSIAPQGIGVATVTVRATDPGGLEATQQVQVTVEASRSERTRALKLALAAFGRSLGAETVEAIGGRLGVESSGSLGRSHVQLGGRSLGCDAFGGGAYGGGNAGAGNAGDGGAAAGGQASCGWEQLARGATGLLGLQLTGPAAMGQGAGGSAMPGGAGVSLDAMSMLFGTGSNGSGGTEAFGAGGGQYRGQQEPAEPGSMDLEQQRGGLTFNPVSGRQMRSQSSFQLSFGGAAADATDANMTDADANATDTGVLPSQAASRSGWTLWGQANAGEFQGTPDDGISMEGRTQSAYVGLDYRFGSGLLLGLAGSRSAMESDFDSRINGAGTVDARLTSLYPYLHWSPREGLGLWGLVGAGRGDADLAEVAGGKFSTDLDMRMGALGVRQELVGALALKADAFSVRIESADGGELAGVTAEAQRVRLAPELTGQWTVGSGGVSVRTRVELGGRYDGGDAETGLGAEAGAEFGFAHLGTGFSVDARGRTLLAHQEDQFREWGASFAVRLQPGRDRGGLSFSLEPSWGDAAGGAQALWQAQSGGFGGQALGRDAAMTRTDAPGWTPDRMAMELGWGVVLPGGGEVKPFGRWSREGADGYRLNAGTRWTALGEQGEGEDRSRGLRLMIDFFGEQVAGGVRPTERRIGLLGQIGFK